ncbi:GVQW3 protein, partial [Acromyrmex charruanus]
MKKNEFHAVIKHLHMKDLTPKEIKAELDNVHSTSTPVFAIVYNWVNEFKHGRTSTCDAPRSGRPIEAATPEIIDKIHDIILTDRQVKVRELVEATNITDSEKRDLPLESSSSKETYFEGLDKSYYSDGLKKLENRWIKCIELKGDYVEK